MIKGTTLAIAVVLLLTGCDHSAAPAPEPGEALSGGGTTVFDSSRDAYSRPAANLDFSGQLNFKVGNSFFRNPWVGSPATTTARDGLGPLMNSNACQNCHIKDGRGHGMNPGDRHAVSMLIRLSLRAVTESEWDQVRIRGGIPDIMYGSQLQDFAIPGHKPEGRIDVQYKTVTVKLAGGESVELRQPIFQLKDPGYGPFSDSLQISPRVAPPMIGLGLLEAISEQNILALADPDDRDKDGISGRPNWVRDVAQDKQALGRFGWKAGQPNIRQQNAGAFAGDMGLTSSLFKDDCTILQNSCRKAPGGGRLEVTDEILDKVTFYASTLAVPARRNVDNPEVLKGKQMFFESQCAACHTPKFVTSKRADIPQLAEQEIRPWTDLLLHDMGPDLADNRPEFLADGREWRTPPLWGIGLARTVSEEATFLHDGRARTLLEAVLWHGGEAEAAKNRVVAMAPQERKALISFLESL